MRTKQLRRLSSNKKILIIKKNLGLDTLTNNFPDLQGKAITNDSGPIS